jgi:putative endonuclease
MAEHNELGKTGEAIARKFLAEKGYKVIAANWRFLKDEIDIIALHDDMVVIVEVKTRSTDMFGDPEEAVSKKKRKFLVRAADAYIRQKDLENEVRFDIVSVIARGEKYEITHIEDAFYATM